MVVRVSTYHLIYSANAVPVPLVYSMVNDNLVSVFLWAWREGGAELSEWRDVVLNCTPNARIRRRRVEAHREWEDGDGWSKWKW